MSPTTTPVLPGDFTEKKSKKKIAKNLLSSGESLRSHVEVEALTIREVAQQTDWADLHPRLLLYAAKLMRMMRWGADGSFAGPKGMEPADFVQDAIDKTLSGRRSWDHQKKSLANHLLDVIKSDISNSANSAENRITSILNEDEKFHLSIEWDTEISLINKDIVRRFFRYIRSRHPEIFYIARSVYGEDQQRPEAIAAAKGVPVSDVKRDIRKLYRVTKSFRIYLLQSLDDWPQHSAAPLSARQQEDEDEDDDEI